jgi:hypothetical protein
VGELVRALGTVSEQPLAEIAASLNALEAAARVVATERQ